MNDELIELIQKARSFYEGVCGHNANAFKYALQCGEILVQIKALAKHGQYLRAVDSVGIPRRTANNYFTIAKYPQHWPVDAELATLASLGEVGIVKLVRHIRKQREMAGETKARKRRQAKQNRTSVEAIRLDACVADDDEITERVLQLDKDDREIYVDIALHNISKIRRTIEENIIDVEPIIEEVTLVSG